MSSDNYPEFRKVEESPLKILKYTLLNLPTNIILLYGVGIGITLPLVQNHISAIVIGLLIDKLIAGACILIIINQHGLNIIQYIFNNIKYRKYDKFLVIALILSIILPSLIAELSFYSSRTTFNIFFVLVSMVLVLNGLMFCFIKDLFAFINTNIILRATSMYAIMKFYDFSRNVKANELETKQEMVQIITLTLQFAHRNKKHLFFYTLFVIVFAFIAFIFTVSFNQMHNPVIAYFVNMVAIGLFFAFIGKYLHILLELSSDGMKLKQKEKAKAMNKIESFALEN